jgi:hypothetical protein
MTELIKIESSEIVATPPQGYAIIFYVEENGRIVKKAKLPDGRVVNVAEE